MYKIKNFVFILYFPPIVLSLQHERPGERHSAQGRDDNDYFIIYSAIKI